MIISMMGVTNHFPPRRAVHSGDHRMPTAESTVNEYRSSTISDDVGVRQGYLLGSALNSFGV